MIYTLHHFLTDLANNASADRAGAFLEIAALDYPWLFDAITQNLDEPPETVTAEILRKYPMFALALIAVPRENVNAFVAKLQQFFKERGYK